jgi:hypothetical protein
MKELPWEDCLLERKVESDLKDLLKTLVAFSNSVRPGHVATILIGEKDDASAPGVTNPDKILKEIRKQCDKIYPAIVCQSKVYEKDGNPCVRVDIEYDGDTPHFGGSAWVRRGSVTVPASDEVFQLLIETRSGLIRELTKWLNQTVTLVGEKRRVTDHYVEHAWPEEELEGRLVFINSFWITLRVASDQHRSLSVAKIRLNFDDEKGRLKIVTLI